MAPKSVFNCKSARQLQINQTLADKAGDAARRKRAQEVADEAFARQMQEEERRKAAPINPAADADKKKKSTEGMQLQMPLAPTAAPAKNHLEADCRVHHLQKDAAQLMEENAAQQRQIQQKEFDLRAAQIKINELKKHQYVHKDFNAPRGSSWINNSNSIINNSRKIQTSGMSKPQKTDLQSKWGDNTGL